MTDSAERDRQAHAAPTHSEPLATSGHELFEAPLRSYINELRARVETLPDDEDTLMVPPGARPTRWVATSIEGALHAAAETVPRSPSSPDSPFPPSTVPPAELSPRKVRRPQSEAVERFPVELSPAAATPVLRARERGHKSGRFVSPAGLRVSVETEGSIAAAVAHLVAEERAQEASSRVEAAATVAVTAPLEAVSASDVTLHAREAAMADEATHGADPSVVLRGVLLFVTASIVSGGAVYALLRG